MNRKELIYYLGLTCALAALSSAAGAQDASANAMQDVGGQPAVAAASPGVPADSLASAGEIVVTARRREERLQDVPVSVTAFSSEQLTARNVQTLSDVQNIAPGVTFGNEAGKSTINVTIRGIGQIPLANGTPGVVTYVNDVPIPSLGSQIPTYDVSSLQVLRGPQGTLFGRNALGGAVLLSTQAPEYRLGGYVEGTYGTFDYRQIQGALNIPIIEDKIALRVAGQLRRQDPRGKVLDGPGGWNNVHDDAFRVSLLIEPFEGLRSTTVYDYLKADEYASNIYLLRQSFSFNAIFPPAILPGVGDALDVQVSDYLAIQRRNRFDGFGGGIDGGVDARRFESITNDTTLELSDSVSVRNIFGYRTAFIDQIINTGAVPTLSVPGEAFGLPAGSTLPFTLFRAEQIADRKVVTNETQLIADFGDLNFIGGFFYNEDQPHGDGSNGTQFTSFAIGPTLGSTISSHVVNKNKAIYAQISYDLTDHLTLNAGGRYSWDKISACGGSLPGRGFISYSECRSVAARDLPEGVGEVRNSNKVATYTLGLDWKPTSDWLLYFTHRKGYRGSSVNTPLFETVFTTGGNDPGCAIPGLPVGQCPDLRPFQTTDVETLYNFEVGSKLSFELGGARGIWNVAAYRDRYKNAVQFLNAQTIVPASAPDFPGSGSVGANLADETITGVETELTVSPTRNITFSLNAAYTHVKIDEVAAPDFFGITVDKSTISTFSPNFSGTVAVNWTLPVHPLDGDLSFNAELFMTDDFGGQGGLKLPGYKLANARLEWKRIAGTGIGIGVFVRNAFNEKYFTGPAVLLQSFPTNSVLVADPRTWGVTGRFSF